MAVISVYYYNNQVNRKLTDETGNLCCKTHFLFLQKTFMSFIYDNMKTMETKANQNQIVIKLDSEDRKQKLPMNLILMLAAGTLAGMIMIFGLFWGVEKLFGV